MKYNYDLVIILVPFLKLIPQSGPASIKASVESAGFSCKVLDWNFELYKRLNIPSGEYNTFVTSEEERKRISKTCDNILDELSGELDKLRPKYVGLSVFGFSTSKSIINKICLSIRRSLPYTKIVAGGHAITTTEKYKKRITYLSHDLLEENLIDYYISGEGEHAIISMLKGEQRVPGLNNSEFKQIKNLNQLPLPDYSDTPPDKYPSKMAFITCSRGCMNKCIYCLNYLNLKLRKPENIIREIVDIYRKYGITKFEFADSALNASPKNIREVCKLLIKYKDDKILPKIEWDGFAYCHSRKLMTEDIYYYMKKSGCRTITIGIESGSKKVRESMNKYINDEDIHFMIKQCFRYNIPLGIFLIVGFFTETENDFLDTIKFLSKIVKYKECIYISGLAPYFINTSTQYDKDVGYDKVGIWYYKENNYITRIRRWFTIVEFCQRYGIKIITRFKGDVLQSLKKYRGDVIADRLIDDIRKLK